MENFIVFDVVSLYLPEHEFIWLTSHYWIMLFIIFIRELGASILLYASGTETISIAMLLLSENLTVTQWSAIACIMAAAMGSAMTRPGVKPRTAEASAATSG